MKQFYDNLGQNIFHTWCCVSLEQKMIFRRFLWTGWMEAKRFLTNHYDSLRFRFHFVSTIDLLTADLHLKLRHVTFRKKHLKRLFTKNWKAPVVRPKVQQVNITASLSRFAKAPCTHSFAIFLQKKWNIKVSVTASRWLDTQWTFFNSLRNHLKCAVDFFCQIMPEIYSNIHEYWWKKFQYLNNITCVVLPSFLTNGIYVLFSCLNKRKKLIW